MCLFLLVAITERVYFSWNFHFRNIGLVTIFRKNLGIHLRRRQLARARIAENMREDKPKVYNNTNKAAK